MDSRHLYHLWLHCSHCPSCQRKKVWRLIDIWGSVDILMGVKLLTLEQILWGNWSGSTASQPGLSSLFRLIAFKQPLSDEGQAQLQRTLARRSRRFARKLNEFRRICKQDQEKVNYYVVTSPFPIVFLAFGPKYPSYDGDADLYIFQPQFDLGWTICTSHGRCWGGEPEVQVSGNEPESFGHHEGSLWFHVSIPTSSIWTIIFWLNEKNWILANGKSNIFKTPMQRQLQCNSILVGWAWHEYDFTHHPTTTTRNSTLI